MFGVVHEVVVHEVGEDEVELRSRGRVLLEHVEHLAERLGLYPVVGVDYLEVHAACTRDALVDAAAPAGIFLVDDGDRVGVTALVVACDFESRVLGAVVDDEDLAAVLGDEQRIDAGAHVGCGIVAGDEKRHDWLLGRALLSGA